MSKVTYNQCGYIGSSMSVRAHEAYEDGEMPKSRWTKKAMLEAIDAWCYDEDRVALPEVAKLKKDELFERCFHWTSWHHTSKYANATDFYGIDEGSADAFSRPMNADELAEAEAERRAEQAQRKAEREANERAKRERALEDQRKTTERKAALGQAYEYIARRSPAFTPDRKIVRTMAADEALHPEAYDLRIAKTGRVMLKQRATHLEIPLDRAFTQEIF